MEVQVEASAYVKANKFQGNELLLQLYMLMFVSPIIFLLLSGIFPC